MVSSVTGAPDLAAAPISPEVLAQMASALFSERPGAGAVPPGIQAPVNVAPPGSPLASPAGLGPSVPGTPIPQGVAPGANLLPASPTPVLSLAHRSPALLPHAQAGNGVPDSVLSNLPAYEPRLGASVQGVPQAVPAYAKTDAYADAESASSYYFLQQQADTPAPDDGLLALAQLARAAAPASGFEGIDLRGPRSATAAPAIPASSAAPQYYFAHAVQLPSGFVTPAKPHPHGEQGKTPQSQADRPGVDLLSHG